MSKIWDERAKEIGRRIKVDGIDTFPDWSVIHATMFVGDGQLIRHERKEVQHLLPLDADTNMVHQAFHLHQWMQATGLSVKDVGSVVEIGGGYGSMFVLWRKLGFSGPYYMVDYTAMRRLQNYYAIESGVKPMPKTAVGHVKASLLIACFSLSELSLQERDEILSKTDYDHHLVAYSGGMWEGVDNTEYFAKWGGVDVAHPAYATIRYKVK